MSFDINKPYTTRDGRSAYAVKLPDGSFAGAMVMPGCINAALWDANGTHCSGAPERDLVNVPEKRTVKVWVNIHDRSALGVHGYESRVEADRYCGADRIACIECEITYKVGEGL